MKQSYGIAKQVRLLEAIDQKLNALLEAQMGKAKADKLIAEYDTPTNPQRDRLNVPETKDAIGALPLEDQANLAAQAENLRNRGTTDEVARRGQPPKPEVKAAEEKPVVTPASTPFEPKGTETKTATSPSGDSQGSAGGATSQTYQQAQRMKAGRSR